MAEPTCGSLLLQLQKIWDEVGESDEERDKALLQIEQECLNVYKRKVEQAAKSKEHLLQTLEDAKLEFSTLLKSLGEKSVLNISQRLKKVLEFVSNLHDICGVLGIDFYRTVSDVHPSLIDASSAQSKSISNDTLARLAKSVIALEEAKKQRLHRLQELAAQLTELWNLMDTSEEERSLFNHVTCNISASVDEVTVPGALALNLIEQAEVEVERLDKLKASKMKEIALKKQEELEEIFAHVHIQNDTKAAREKILALIDSGNVEPAELLADMDAQVIKAKEEALSRKDILDKVEKWMSACEEESWLEDYNRDNKRYSGGRGAHLNLKRAEKARILVSKIPGIVDTLVAKTQTWEEEHGITFAYDGVPLLDMLNEYSVLRHDREEEKRRIRDQKKYHEQLNTGQEAMFGTKPSPARPLSSSKKMTGPNGAPNRRLSLNQNGTRSVKRDHTRPVAPLNYVAISKEDPAAVTP
ncbi:hypothetical protein M8C21_031544 [Ambrosia artemisiifolia]|uniref:65-kDa microtubule-associated protein 1 n=1 Tax=Ambrosia artemisiifolia TaxID=4212 RepID=A0AAD5GKX4_AMBAR|nr:hypothetical protein M8C21_031544 [Ambrosia artemisiifolia]